jgi:superfamily I DNA/RNA helicase
MKNLGILLGPPGTGKTTRLLQIVENLGATYQPNEICYVAFTRKAANEARVRAIDKFGWDPDLMKYFSTLHSLAFKTLGINRTEVMGVRDYFEVCSKLGLHITFNHVSDDGMITGLAKGDRLLFMENLARVRGQLNQALQGGDE